MTSQQLNINLGFSADTTQAKKQLQDLQFQLNKLVSNTNLNKSNFALTKDIKEATLAATQLQVSLEAATNVNTGRLDLGKFSQSLKQSGMTIDGYKKSLHQLGPAGDQAFASLAKSIMQAEIPLKRSNALISEMWVSLKNTARWQISSSVLHGFMGAVQSAYGYAQDLNKSLNDIRIVTGQNTDEMAKFAERANKAAKALSTTTTDYTNASLIYYQQGLSDSEVQARTDITIKMANAAGQSAQIVSDQMTAVWNNFDDGSKSLEYYADVMTALGAATASSTDEIANGIEKFAAISETVGLSYEYATAALATVTDKTRQSAEVVGTAFKTMFARIQGLKLGETLEDGTDLNQYSEALLAVGVNIKDANGELKDMDTILNEMAVVWETLNRDEQVALAQKVAGVRQYNQLMSLMENWDAMEINLEVANNSEGELQKQSDIYAQSWEAASKRVTAAAESIYSALLNDEFFIDLNNGLAGFLEGLGKIIDGIGGLKGILLMIGSVALTVFRDQISQSVQNIVYSIKMLTTKGKEQVKELRDQANQALINGSNGTPETVQEKARAEAYAKMGSLQNAYLKNASKMSEEQKKIAQSLMDQQQILIKNVELANEEVTAAEEKLALAERKMTSGFQVTEKDEDGDNKKRAVTIGDEDKEKIKTLTSSYKELQVQASQYQKFLEQIGKVKLNSKEFEEQKKNLKAWSDQIKKSGIDIEKVFGSNAKKAFDAFNKELEDSDGTVESLDKALDKLYSSIDGVAVGTQEFEQLERIFKELGMPIEEIQKRMDRLTNSANKTGESYSNLSQKSSILSSYTDQITKNFEQLHATTSVGDKFMAVASSIGNVVSIVNTFQSTMESLNDSDLSFGEKIMAVMSGISMIVPSVIALLNAQNVALIKSAGMWILEAGAKKLSAGNSMIAVGASKLLEAIKNKESIAVAANSVAWYANPIMWIAVVVMGVVAAIGLLVAGIALFTEWLIKGDKINTKYCDTLIENAEKTKELAEANNELSDSMDDLINEYDELNEKGENTANTLQKISEEMPKLIQSYRDFAEVVNVPGLEQNIDELERLANIAKFTGDYSDFNKHKQVVDDTVAIATAAEAKTGAVSANTKLAAAMQDSQGKVSGKSYNLHVGGSQGGGADNDEKDAIDILKEEMGSYAKNAGKNEIDLNIEDYTDPTKLVDYYEKMVQARDRMLNEMSEEQLAESDTFREINEIIGDTSEAYQEAKEQAADYLVVVGDALEAEMRDSKNLQGLGITGEIDNMEEYLAYRERYIELAEEEYGLTEEQAIAQLKHVEGLERMNNEYALASTMLKNFSGLTEEQIKQLEENNPEELKKQTETVLKQVTSMFGEFSDVELEMAVSIAANSNSLEDFANQMQIAMVESARAGYQQSASIASETLKNSLENNSIDLSALLDDDNFVEYLEGIGSTAETITAASYEEQYRIISEFYSKVSTLAFQSFGEQQNLYYEQIASLQAELSAYQQAVADGNKYIIAEQQAEYQKLKDELADADSDAEIEELNAKLDEMAQKFQQDYSFNIETNINEVQNEIDTVFDRIEELQNQKIEMAMDWSGVDDLAAGYKKAAEFTQMIKKDTKKVGNTYQMTAAQAREWLEFYPELGKIAKVTSDGLISMNQAEVDAFIDGKEKELDTDIAAKIEHLKAEKAVLEEDLKVKQLEFDAAKLLAEGKLDLENVSAEYLTNLRTNLTDYFITLGLDETAANAAALETMGLNEEEYSRLVAANSENQAENMANAAEDGANAQKNALTQLVGRWKNFATYLIQNIGPLLLEIGKAILDPTRTVGAVLKGAWDASAITVNVDGSHSYTTDDGSYTFNGGDEFQKSAALKEIAQAQLDGVSTSMDSIKAAIGSLDGQIAYLESLGIAGLEDYGSTDPTGGNKDKDSGDTKKEEKDLEKIAERYHEITKEIEYYEHLLNKLGKLSEVAHGGKKVKLMKQEQKALEELCKKQEDLLYLQLAFIEVDKQKVQDTFTTEAVFDVNGNLTNYTQLVEEATSRLNAAREAYNNSKQEDVDKEALEAAEKKYEEELAVLEQYEETVEAARKQEEELIELAIQLQQKRLDTITYTIELNIEADQKDLKYLDYELAKLEDQAFSTAESIGLITQQYKNLQQQSKTLRAGEKQILNQYLTEEEVNAFYEGNMEAIDWSTVPEAAIEKLNEYSDELLSVNEQLLELRKTMDESVIKAFEEWSEEMKGQIELFDHYDSVISNYQNIIDLTGQKKLGISDQEMIEYNQLKVNNANNKLASSKIYYDETQEKINAAEAAKAEAQQRLEKATASGNQEAIEGAKKDVAMWEKTLETMYEENRNAEQAYLEDWEAALEASRDAFLAETDMQLKALEEQMAGTYGNLEAMHEEFDQKSEINERYLQDYERMYELSKLNRDLIKQMDETSNVKAKQELAKLQEEILGYQEEGRKMSKYDLEYLQKRYDLKLAEIAMEEAQQAKTQVRLTRDTDGNFSYTYTADEESMAEAQQTYEDKLFEITDLSNNHIEDQTEQLLSTQQEYIDKLAEIHQKAAEGQYATTEEYQKALDDCTAYYTEKMRYHGGEIDKATLNNAVVYADDYATYEHYIGRKLSETERLQREMDADIIEARAQVEKLQIEKQAALDEIHRLHAEGYYATEEEYQAALSKVEEDYGDRIANANVKVNTLVADRVAKYGEDSEAYSLETAKKAAAEEGFVTSIKSYLPELEDAHDSVSGYVGNVVEAIGSAKDGTGYLGQASKSYAQLDTNIETAMKNAGTSMKTFKEDTYKKLISDKDSIANQSEKVKDKVAEMAEEITNLDDTIKTVKNWQKEYSAQLEKIIKKNEDVIKSTNKMNQTLAKQAEKEAKKTTPPTTTKPTTTKPTTNPTKTNDENKLETASTKTKKGVAYAIWSGYWGNGDSRKKLVNQKLGKGAYTTYQSLVNEYDIAKKANNGTWEKDLYGSYSKNPQAKLKKDYGPDAFYTGGYTGAWGPDGKLAILHEKELVLNKQDTENMLKMVTMVRDIAAVLDLQAYQSSLAQLTANSLGTMSNTQKMFEQTVTIHAEFPDAVYATEIETALNNLVNSASQYANRKN